MDSMKKVNELLASAFKEAVNAGLIIKEVEFLYTERTFIGANGKIEFLSSRIDAVSTKAENAK